MSVLDPLANVVLELAGRNHELANCWEQVLQDLDIELGDIVADDNNENEAIQSLRKATHEVLAERLKRWAVVQRKMQPVMDRLDARCEKFQDLAYGELEDCLAWQKWQHVEGNQCDLNSVHVFKLDGGSTAEKASCVLAGGVEAVATHLWCQQNQKNDNALLMWRDGPTEFELRRRRVKITLPFADDREFLYIRMVHSLPDKNVAILSCSLTNTLARSLQADLEWFSVPLKVKRSWILDCFIVKQLCTSPAICQVERLTRFSEGGGPVPILVRKAGGVSFNTKVGITTLKEAIVNGKLDSSAASSLAVFGGGAAVGGVAGPAAVTGVVTAAGFSSTGIVAGSAAASAMSASATVSGGGVASGSLVAVGQSIGTAGVAGGPLGLAIVGGAVVAGTAAVGIFFGAKAIHKKIGDVKRKPGGPVHHCPTCDDRKLSKL